MTESSNARQAFLDAWTRAARRNADTGAEIAALVREGLSQLNAGHLNLLDGTTRKLQALAGPPRPAPNGMTSINGTTFPSGSDIEVTTVSGRTYLGKVGHMFPAGFVLHTVEGPVELGSSSITSVRPVPDPCAGGCPDPAMHAEGGHDV